MIKLPMSFGAVGQQENKLIWSHTANIQ